MNKINEDDEELSTPRLIFGAIVCFAMSISYNAFVCIELIELWSISSFIDKHGIFILLVSIFNFYVFWGGVQNILKVFQRIQ